MIQLSAAILQTSDWKNELSQAIRDPAELLRLLELPETYLPGALRAHRLFPIRAPRPYINRIKKGDPNDPLLRQILPLHLESDQVTGYSDDPVGDLASQKLPGLLHKYKGRALLITTAACAIHCRYCFRRNFPYANSRLSDRHWQEVLHYLASDRGLNEVILSGGDPLSLSDDRLQQMILQLENIPHIQTLRIHTRLPIVVPQRITESLIQLLSATSLKTVVVTHINHANEIDSQVKNTLSSLRDTGVTLLNQAVLLAGVNDSVDSLKNLSNALFNCGILPYYLHQLDKVNGAAHFAVNLEQALTIADQLRKQLPGYLVPRLVEERSGEPSKRPLLGIQP